MSYLVRFTFLLLSFFSSFSQGKSEKIEYLYDKAENYNNSTIIESTAFAPLVKDINNGLKNGVYWFKISNLDTNNTTIQIANSTISKAIAYQGNQQISIAKYERFLTFKTTKKETVYLKINVTREALIPIRVKTSEKFSNDEKRSFLFLGFYYGFAFVIGLINLFYFINFRDRTFLYYMLFLYFITFGFSISDGVLMFFGFEERAITVIEVIDHFLVIISSVFFAKSYLQTEDYYPGTKRNMLISCGLVFVFGLIFLFTGNQIWYVMVDFLVFGSFIYLWILGCLLFDKNIFIKIFVIAYFFILLLGLSFYITKLVGIPIIISADLLKLGGLFEMIVLSFAVVYRMRILQQENSDMRKEIISYAKELENISIKSNKTESIQTKQIENVNLTSREKEILEAVVAGKSNKEISEELSISVNTVKYHVKNVYGKLNIKNRSEIKKLSILSL